MSQPNATPTPRVIAKTIDHALLKPTMTLDEIEAGYDLAIRLDVASVCVMPFGLARCAERLADCTVEPSTVIGFPHGVNTTAAKAAEAEQALADGGTELDMVVNTPWVLSAKWGDVAADIKAVLEPTHAGGQKIKVIFETCQLGTSHIARLSELCTELGADWIKTSTGFGSVGATPEAVRTMRAHAGDQVQIKASGGVRTLDDVILYRELGCTRCGSSSTEAIMAEATAKLAAE
ncbi:MAG: deoxyribose-phosphate aldolase [Planctomycetota bacterium]